MWIVIQLYLNTFLFLFCPHPLGLTHTHVHTHAKTISKLGAKSNPEPEIGYSLLVDGVYCGYECKMQ